MIKYLLGGAAATAMVAIAPAIAQTPAPAPVAPQIQDRLGEPGWNGLGRDAIHTRATVGKHIGSLFGRLDTNRDGFVTKAEAAAVKVAHAGKRGDRSARRSGARNPGAMFDRLDTNRDGSISRSEFENRRAHHQQRIARRDTDGDGRPDGRRMHGGRMGMGLGGRMFDMADSNRDGRVSLQEATAAAYRHFDMADANRDGQITREERVQMRQRMRAQRRPG